MPGNPSTRTAQTVAAGSLVGIGSFQGFLAFWDWLTTGDSLMSIYEHLPHVFHYVNHPASTTVIVVFGLALLWWVTRDAPKPVTLYGANYHVPLPKKKHPVVRDGLVSVGLAAVAATAFGTYHYYRTSYGAVPAQDNAKYENQPVLIPPAASVTQSSPNATPLSSTPKEVSAKASQPTKPEPKPAQSVPVVIPVPDRAASPDSAKSAAQQPTVTIGETRVRARDKPEGTLYVALRLSEISRYRGGLDDSTIAAVKAALDQTHKVSVFVGQYNIGNSSRSYGVGGLSEGKSKTIYYFDRALGDSCIAIQKIIRDAVSTPMECVFAVVPNESNPNALNLQFDTWQISGIDIEIWL